MFETKPIRVIRCAGFAATRACAPARKRVSGAPCIFDTVDFVTLHLAAHPYGNPSACHAPARALTVRAH